MNQSVIEVRNLRKLFGRKLVVHDVNFSMHEGEVVGLLGPNGAGKTTTFYMIAGFLHPSQGSIFLDDHEVTKLPMYLRARAGISYLPQESSVFRNMTVENNILSILETRRLTKKERAERLEELLHELGITALRKQMAYTLSGGERRRTEIARAMAIKPKFLLLDEPFAGVDPITVAEIKKIIRLLAEKGIGVLITDHNVHDTLDITHRACIINMGEIIAQGDKTELLKNELARKFYLGENFGL